MSITSLKVVAALAGLCASLSCHAAFPAGQWQSHQTEFTTGEFINDVNYCILSNGTFYPVETPTDIGYWNASNGVVLLRFATAENSFTGSYTLKKKSKVLMQGQGQSWFFPDASGGFYINAEWTQTGTCS